MEIQDFVKEAYNIPPSEAPPKAFDYYIHIFDAFSRITQLSFFVIDYHKQKFVYISDNPSFLCGYSRQEVLEMGNDFFFKVLSEEDQKRLIQFQDEALRNFYICPINLRMKMSISADFDLIQPDKRRILINYKLTPIHITESGQMWLALCVVSLSTKTVPGVITTMMDGELFEFNFSPETNELIRKETVSLSKREKEVLQISAQGFSNKQIGDKLFIDINTVKFHKRNIYSKLDVKNITEAVTFAQNNGLI